MEVTNCNQVNADEPPLRLLLIEDNPGDIDLLRETLAEADGISFEICHVTSLAEAMPRLRGDRFDAVLLDLSLPDSHGLESFDRLKADESNLPVIVLTGLDDRATAELAVRQGAQDYLVKGQVSCELLVRSIRYAIERHRLLAEVKASSLIDELTGLYNRRGLLAAAEVMFKMSARLEKGITLVFIDLDGMKKINDSLGHHSGDRALIDAAAVLKQTFRESDVLARLGGDEFAAIAAGTTADSGLLLEARLQDRVRARNAAEECPYLLSLSVGLVYCDPDRPWSIQQMLRLADVRMYEQKRAKRAARSGEYASVEAQVAL
jgi:two-component system cell cycle response regulator